MTIVGESVDAAPVPTIRPTVGQYRVLVELCRDGASDREIGKRLFLTENTVKCHIKRLLAKTPFANRTELAVAILRRDIMVEPPA